MNREHLVYEGYNTNTNWLSALADITINPVAKFVIFAWKFPS